MSNLFRRNWDPSYGFLSPQPRNRNTARIHDWRNRAGGEEGTSSPAPSTYSERGSSSTTTTTSYSSSRSPPDWNRNLAGRESHIPLSTSLLQRQQQQQQRQQLRNGVAALETSSTSWHRGRLPPAAAVTATTDNDCHRHADNNLNCRISRPADNNRNNIYRTVGEAEAADNMGRLSRLVSDVEENYYQTIHTPQAADKRGGRPPLLLSDYQSLAGSPAKSTSSSAGRLSSSDYQAVGSPLAARSQPPHQRLFESPRRRAGGPPTQSNIPVPLSRPWAATSAPVAASAPSSSNFPSAMVGSPRRDQKAMHGLPQQQLANAGPATAATAAAVLRPQPAVLTSEGRIYGTGGSDKTGIYRGGGQLVPNYNPVNRNMYNLQTGRSSLLASPYR